MNRCLHRLFTGAALCALLVPALAQQMLVRPFPDAALRGVLQVTQPPAILIDAQPQSLTPGARIHARNNLLVGSASLVGQVLLVNYLLDMQGQVQELWVLNGAEASQPRAMGPQLTFLSAGQTLTLTSPP